MLDYWSDFKPCQGIIDLAGGNVPNAMITLRKKGNTSYAPAQPSFNTELLTNQPGPPARIFIMEACLKLQVPVPLEICEFLDKFIFNSKGYAVLLEIQAFIEVLWHQEKKEEEYDVKDKKKKNKLYDSRDPRRVIYKAGVVVLVVILAKLCNCRTCVEIANFWHIFKPLLRLIIKDMPAPEYNISAETVRAICSMTPKGTMEKVLVRYFNNPKIPLGKLLQYQSVSIYCQISENGVLLTSPYRGTIGADGQEIRSSYIKGERSCHKDYLCVTCYYCSGKIALGYKLVEKKNHETSAIQEIIENYEENIEQEQKDANRQNIFIADAMNNTAELCSFLRKRGRDYILPLKTNNGWKPLHDAVEKLFLDFGKKGSIELSKILEKQGHGRIEQYKYMMLPVPQVPEGTPLPEDIHSVILVKHQSVRHIKGTLPGESDFKLPEWRYYFSSLGADRMNFAQAMHTIGERWQYEVHHHMLDTVLMQDRTNMCNSKHLDFTCGVNKIAGYVGGFIRQNLSQLMGKISRPISYMSTFKYCSANLLLALAGLLDCLETAPVNAHTD